LGQCQPSGLQVVLQQRLVVLQQRGRSSNNNLP
jgi:hypothetical protein